MNRSIWVEVRRKKKSLFHSPPEAASPWRKSRPASIKPRSEAEPLCHREVGVRVSDRRISRNGQAREWAGGEPRRLWGLAIARRVPLKTCSYSGRGHGFHLTSPSKMESGACCSSYSSDSAGSIACRHMSCHSVKGRCVDVEKRGPKHRTRGLAKDEDGFY